MNSRANRQIFQALLVALTLVAAILLSSKSCAQQGLEAYDRGDLDAVRAYLSGDSLEPAERLFLQAAMTASADSAVELYRLVVLKYPESPVSQRALDRIRQYYYALGLYEKAKEFEKPLQEYTPPQRRLEGPAPEPVAVQSQAPPLTPPPDTTKISPPPLAQVSPARARGFCLQVGAFASSANAQKLKASLEKAGYQVRIIPAAQNPRGLQLVRVVGYANESDALSAAQSWRSSSI